MVDWSLYGKNPAGYHVTNLCLHAANAILLFLLLLYITGTLARSAIVAFLFALHPAHVESVAWIAERRTFCARFSGFGIACHVRGMCASRRGRGGARGVRFCLRTALSKPMIVTFPFTLLLLDIWPLRRITFSAETCGHLGHLFLEVMHGKVAAVYHGGDFKRELHLSPASRRRDDSLGFYLCGRESATRRSVAGSHVRLTFWPDLLSVYYYYDFNHISLIWWRLSL